ncbi:MAG TPA: PLP-dependent aminotransferase family protein [Vicinamibacterales bacterium]|jgi:DNA-binding transcriptional MocR family regulator|nr:PLP-dependent aminotransferase family protein [Vicinamibacterales bacterium]
MRRTAAPQQNQSVIGLFRALKVDPAAVPRSRPFYRRLVELIDRGVTRHELPAGFRLPPERDLARTLRVSRATVVAAYRELEARGLVRAYVGRGTFICARPDPGSAPFSWRGKVSAAALQSDDATVRDLVAHAADPGLTSFAAGTPALECFPTDALRRAIDAILSRDASVALKLGPTEGQPRFRATLAERFGGSPENILVIAGAQQGLDLLARCLVDPGDTVIIDRPGYLGAISSFRSAGARLAGWDLQRADLDELEELMLRYRPKLLYLNPTHQNPTGITLPIRARRELIELAERYRVPIIEDDTYRELTLSAPPPPSLYELDELNTVVIHLNSFAKMLAPGLRLGWISAVPAIVEQLALIKQRVDPHTQNLAQLAVSELIETGAFDRHIGQLRGEHRRRRDAMVKALRQHVAPDKLRFGVPEGGLYLWCRLAPQTRARDVQREAFRDRVVFVPGEAFYVDRGGAHELRICYTAQPAERAVLAAQALARAIAVVERQTETELGLVSLA